jgi:hypothetical protein
MLIVLTDGETPDLKGGKASEIGQNLKSQKIIMYAISVRSEGSSDDLRTACQITGGQLFDAGDMPGLQSDFHQIDQLQRTTLAAAQTQWRQHDRPFALIGLLLLAVHQLTSPGLRYAPW